MMKFLFLLLFFMLIFFFLNFNLIQLFHQNFMFFLLFMFLIKFSLNSMNLWSQIYYYLGCDTYSYCLVLLSLWILSLMVMVSLNNYMNLLNIYYFYILNIMLLFLILCFMSMNLILFYLFFESSLIPIFMLIMGWGFQVDRVQAGFYMMLYTLLGSLPLFFMIMNMYQINNSLMMPMINLYKLNMYMYMMMTIAFFIKMPIYFFHLWLPKAHVEAPLSGSMILAGVMLKLGSYGLMRFMLMSMHFIKFNKFIMIISLMGGIYSSLICLCQLDMKMLVAYSSVVHMSVLMAGMMTMFNWGYLGGLMMMISHGLCSSGLFCLVNINYERMSSRSLIINKGMINFFPSLSLMWFLLCSSNLSFPPSFNLFSEIMLINSLILWMKELILLLMLLLFFSACYSLYLYSYSQHGFFNNFTYFMKNILVNEFMVLLMHWIPLNVLFLFMIIYL